MSEYMPKVGEVCDISYIRIERLPVSDRGFDECRIEFINEFGVVAACGKDSLFLRFNAYSVIFRPLKTKQDIEREETIECLFELINLQDSSYDNAERIVDAGYHNGLKVGECSGMSIHERVRQLESTVKRLEARDVDIIKKVVREAMIIFLENEVSIDVSNVMATDDKIRDLIDGQ